MEERVSPEAAVGSAPARLAGLAKENGEDARCIFTVSDFSDGELGALFTGLRACVTAGEFLDPPGGIDELLFTGEERMAGRADADLDVALRGTGVIDGAARARNRRFAIVGMNICFHGLKREWNIVSKAEPANKNSRYFP
jgi:hypothetical protein